jgi:hypothetical protein
MTSIIKVDTIQDQSGNNIINENADTITIGASGDTISIPSGATLSSTDPLVFPAGTALLPAITTTGDVNTGMWFPAADTIAFTEGGAEAMRINSSGQVGIGTASPAVKFQTTIASSGVSGIAATGVALFENSGNSDVVIGAGTSSKSRIAFADSGDWIIGRIDYDHSDNSMRFGTNGTAERMRITSAGEVLINTTSTLGSGYLNIEGQGATYCAVMDSDSGSGGLIGFFFGGSAVGNINTNGTTTSYVTSSDYRLKENVDYNFDATTRLKQLKPARFNFIRDANRTVDGFLAHEVQDIIPEAITGTKDQTETKEKVVVNSNGRVIAENIEQADWEAGKILNEEGTSNYPVDSTWEASKVVPVYQGIDQAKLTPILTKALQEAIARIEQLEARLTALENN